MLKQTVQKGFYQDRYGNYSAKKNEVGYVLTEHINATMQLTVGTFKTLKECNEIVRYGWNG